MPTTNKGGPVVRAAPGVPPMGVGVPGVGVPGVGAPPLGPGVPAVTTTTVVHQQPRPPRRKYKGKKKYLTGDATVSI